MSATRSGITSLSSSPSRALSRVRAIGEIQLTSPCGTIGLVNAFDGDGALHILVVHIGDGGAKENLVIAKMHRRVAHFGNFQALGQKTNAAINLAQALFAVQVVAVLGAVAIAGCPMHDFNDLGALVVDQVEQLIAQRRIALGGDVVFATAGR